MSTVLCPRCRVPSQVTSSITEVEQLDDEGEPQEIRVRSYHCLGCGTFLYDENLDDEVEAQPEEIEERQISIPKPKPRLGFAP